MKRVETEHGEILETLIPRLINDYGMSATADQINVSKSTINYWCLKLGIEVRRVAMAPGRRLEIRGVAKIADE